jgi:hypothetical protein
MPDLTKLDELLSIWGKANKVGFGHRLQEAAAQQKMNRSTFPHMKWQNQYSKAE